MLERTMSSHCSYSAFIKEHFTNDSVGHVSRDNCKLKSEKKLRFFISNLLRWGNVACCSKTCVVLVRLTICQFYSILTYPATAVLLCNENRSSRSGSFLNLFFCVPYYISKTVCKNFVIIVSDIVPFHHKR